MWYQHGGGVEEAGLPEKGTEEVGVTGVYDRWELGRASWARAGDWTFEIMKEMRISNLGCGGRGGRRPHPLGKPAPLDPRLHSVHWEKNQKRIEDSPLVLVTSSLHTVSVSTPAPLLLSSSAPLSPSIFLFSSTKVLELKNPTLNASSEIHYSSRSK